MPNKRSTYIVAAVSLVVIALAVYFLFIFQKGTKVPKPESGVGEVKEVSEIELERRPFVTLTPTSDGAEIIISIESMSNFDRIEYELTYLADNPQMVGEKIQRGATGADVNTKDQKYKKSILLGTASRGVRSPDKSISEGKLTMHLFKEEVEYLSKTGWNLQQTGSSTTTLQDESGNFELKVASFGKSYWVIVADTIGLMPSYPFDPKDVILPTYGVFSVAPELTTSSNLSIKLAQSDKTSQLYSASHADSKWLKIESNYTDSTKTITAKINSFATYVVVSPK